MKKIILTSLALNLICAAGVYAQETVVNEQPDVKLSVEQTSVQEPVEVKPVADKKVVKNIYYPILNMLGEYKNEIKAVYTEIDGILTPENKRGEVFSDDVHKAVFELKENNIPLILATGRTFREAKRAANALNITPEYYITQNGAEIVDSEGNLISEETIDNYTLYKINSEVKWFNYYYNQDLRITFNYRCQVYSYRGIKVPDLIDVPVLVDKFSELPNDMNVSKVRVYGVNEVNLENFKRYMIKYYPNLNVENATKHSLEFTSKKATKANAIKVLAAKTGIDLCNSAVFGYYQPDVELLNMVRENGGLSISSKDSKQQVKEESLYITKDYDNDGFAFAIQNILGNNKILKDETLEVENSTIDAELPPKKVEVQ